MQSVARICTTECDSGHSLRHVLDGSAPLTPTPEELAPVGFVIEQTYWDCSDTGRLWRGVRFTEWVEAWRHFVRPVLGDTCGRESVQLWKSVWRAFNRLKRRMPVAFAVIEREGRVLMVHCSDTSHSVSLPGGKCFTGWGESIVECLLREVREEVCVEVGAEQVRLEHSLKHRRREYFVYKVHLAEGQEPRPDGREIVRLEWCAPSDACRPVSNVLKELLRCPVEEGGGRGGSDQRGVAGASGPLAGAATAPTAQRLRKNPLQVPAQRLFPVDTACCN